MKLFISPLRGFSIFNWDRVAGGLTPHRYDLAPLRGFNIFYWDRVAGGLTPHRYDLSPLRGCNCGVWDHMPALAGLPGKFP